MFRSTVKRILFPIVVMVLWNPGLAGVPQNENPRPVQELSLPDVLKLVRSGMSEEVVVTSIKRNGHPFNLSVDELLALKKEGVSDAIITHLMDPSAPYTPPPPPAVPAVAAPVPATPAPATPGPGKTYPDDPAASKVPMEAGAYVLQQGKFNKLDLKVLVAAKEGGGLGSLLTAGLLKTRLLGYLVGEAAKTRIEAPVSIYFRLADSATIEDIALVALEVQAKEKRRELEFSTPKEKDEKPNLNVQSMRPFEALEVGPKLYRITAANLGKGEYLFYLIGSADPKKGNHGKGYDFGLGL